jgi:salicylate synthetase
MLSSRARQLATVPGDVEDARNRTEGGDGMTRPRPADPDRFAAVQYLGRYDPVATFRRLREAGQLGAHAYLHIGSGHAEIGWAAREVFRALDGRPAGDWRTELQGVADRAAAQGTRAFGYVGFDAVDGACGTLPDASSSGRPLVEFIVPGQRLRFGPHGVRHVGGPDAAVARCLAARATSRPARSAPRRALSPTTGTSAAAFMDAVGRATAALRAGEADKVVLSRHHAYDVDYDPLALFEHYCRAESFVDAALICFGDLAAMVASPELLVAVDDGALTANPLAGTRRRGATPEEDARLARELAADHKELAEHVLSVTTMLAELEPLCRPDSLVVRRLLDVSRQRRVQHLSSVLTGALASGRGALDALWAVFPAVTVTGLPRTPALALLRRLEAQPRALYGGAVGWMRGRADCRFALAIRSVFRYGRRTFLHAGAGIMPESRPEAELSETTHKLRAMEDALACAMEVPEWADLASL